MAVKTIDQQHLPPQSEANRNQPGHEPDGAFRQALRRVAKPLQTPRLIGEETGLESREEMDRAAHFQRAFQRMQKPLTEAAQEEKQPESPENLGAVRTLAHMHMMGLNKALLSAFGQPDQAVSQAGDGLWDRMEMPDITKVWDRVKNKVATTLRPALHPEFNLSAQAHAAVFTEAAVKTEPTAPVKPAPLHSDFPDPPLRQSQAPPVEAAAKSQETDALADNKPVDQRTRIENIIVQTARKHGLDPHLVRAVVKTESNFNPEAVSHAGAMGLMQLMPATAKDLGVDDPFDPTENVDGGARYLKQMLGRYSGDLDKALAAYNWGPGNFDRSRGRWMPRETRNYIRIVNRHYQRFAQNEAKKA
jgi:hypothetical protein